MAYDKVVDSAQLDGALSATADAIRGKTGETAPIQWDAGTGFASAVESIPTGGGTPAPEPVQPKEVNFYDYDGTCVHAYTVEEVQALTELPPGPTHDGLVFQGWNWTLEDVKALTRAMNIGALYITDDGKTRLYITLQEGRTSPMLGVGVNGTVTVDWGDGTEPDVLTGTNGNTVQWTPTHEYAAPGDYVIRLTVDGKMGFLRNSDGCCVLRYTTVRDVQNQEYAKALTKAEIGNGVSSTGSFIGCKNLKTINTTAEMGNIAYRAFKDCHCLLYHTIPVGSCPVDDEIFANCYDLQGVSMSNAGSKVGNAVFSSCYALEAITLPDGVAQIGNSAFANDYRLEKIHLPQSIATLGVSVFDNCYSLDEADLSHTAITTLSQSTYSNCWNLEKIKLPSSVATIALSSMANLKRVQYIDFTALQSVPTLPYTSAFTNLPDDCEIRVPAALYDEWIAATNWTSYADHIKAY